MEGIDRDALELLIDRMDQDTAEDGDEDLHAFFCMAWPTPDAQSN